MNKKLSSPKKEGLKSVVIFCYKEKTHEAGGPESLKKILSTMEAVYSKNKKRSCLLKIEDFWLPDLIRY